MRYYADFCILNMQTFVAPFFLSKKLSFVTLATDWIFIYYLWEPIFFNTIAHWLTLQSFSKAVYRCLIVPREL
jgi:hypothetical protein